MRIKHQLISALLVISMAIASIPVIVLPVSSVPDLSSSLIESDLSDQDSIIPIEDGSLDIGGADGAHNIIGEDVTKRDRFSKHYVCSDGSYIAVVGAEAVHYQTDEGSWEEIDNTLTFDSSSEYYKNDKSESGFGVSFAKNPAKEDAVIISDGETSISWYIEGISSGNGGNNKVNPSNSSKIKIRNNKSNANSRFNGKGGKENSSISYENIFGENIDAILRYSVSENKIEEDIIFQNVPQISAYTMNIKAPGMEAYVNEDGSVSIVAKNGKALYTIDAPIMYDAEGSYSSDIEVSVQRHGNVIKVTYTPDMTWLEDSARVYPVTLDPIVTTSQYTSNITDTYIIENVTRDGSQSDTIIAANHNVFGRMISYVRFNDIPQMGYYATLTKAELVLCSTQNTVDTSNLKMSNVTSDWTAAEITYATRPSMSTVCLNSQIARTQTEDIYDSDECEYLPCYAYSFDFTSDVESYITDNVEISDTYWDYCYGFAIEYTGSSYEGLHFIASEHESKEHRPTLILSYAPSTPNFISNGGVYNFYNAFSLTYLSSDTTCPKALENSVPEPTIYESFKLIESTAEDGSFNGYKFGIMADDTNVLHAYSEQDVFQECEMAISVNAISGTYADNQDWIITHINNDLYTIGLRDCPNLVLSVYEEDVGEFNLSLEYFTNDTNQLWEIHASGEQLNYDMLNVSCLFSEPQPTYEMYEGETVKLFCPIYNYGDSVDFISADTNTGIINSADELTACRAGTISIDVVEYNEDGDEDGRYEVDIDVILNAGVYSIASSNGTVLTVENGDIENATPVILTTNSQEWYQMWRIKYLGDGWYSVRPMHDLTMALDVTDYVDIWNIGTEDTLTTVDAFAQWKIKYQDGGYTFFNANEELYLTASSDESIAESYGSTYGVQQFELSTVNVSPGIILTKTVECMSVGESVNIRAVYYSPDVMVSQDVSWSLSPSNIASISSSGVISATASGVVTVTAQMFSTSKQFDVIIKKDYLADDGIFKLQCGSLGVCAGASRSQTYVRAVRDTPEELEWWLFKRISDNLYTIYNLGKRDISVSSVHYGKNEFVLCPKTTTYDEVGVSIYNSSDTSQQWYVWSVGDYFMLQNKSTGEYLNYAASSIGTVSLSLGATSVGSIFYADEFEWKEEANLYLFDWVYVDQYDEEIENLHFKIVIDDSIYEYTDAESEIVDSTINEAALRWNNISSNIHIYASNDNTAPYDAIEIEFIYLPSSEENLDEEEKVTLGKFIGLNGYGLDTSRLIGGQIALFLDVSRYDGWVDVHAIKGIVTHEMGHALGLCHINITAPISYNENISVNLCSCMYRETTMDGLTYYPSQLDKLMLTYKWGE